MTEGSSWNWFKKNA